MANIRFVKPPNDNRVRPISNFGLDDVNHNMMFTSDNLQENIPKPRTKNILHNTTPLKNDILNTTTCDLFITSRNDNNDKLQLLSPLPTPTNISKKDDVVCQNFEITQTNQGTKCSPISSINSNENCETKTINFNQNVSKLSSNEGGHNRILPSSSDSIDKRKTNVIEHDGKVTGRDNISAKIPNIQETRSKMTAEGNSVKNFEITSTQQRKGSSHISSNDKSKKVATNIYQNVSKLSPNDGGHDHILPDSAGNVDKHKANATELKNRGTTRENTSEKLPNFTETQSTIKTEQSNVKSFGLDNLEMMTQEHQGKEKYISPHKLNDNSDKIITNVKQNSSKLSLNESVQNCIVPTSTDKVDKQNAKTTEQKKRESGRENISEKLPQFQDTPSTRKPEESNVKSLGLTNFETTPTPQRNKHSLLSQINSNDTSKKITTNINPNSSKLSSNDDEYNCSLPQVTDNIDKRKTKLIEQQKGKEVTSENISQKKTNIPETRSKMKSEQLSVGLKELGLKSFEITQTQQEKKQSHISSIKSNDNSEIKLIKLNLNRSKISSKEDEQKCMLSQTTENVDKNKENATELEQRGRQHDNISGEKSNFPEILNTIKAEQSKVKSYGLNNLEMTPTKQDNDHSSISSIKSKNSSENMVTNNNHKLSKLLSKEVGQNFVLSDGTDNVHEHKAKVIEQGGKGSTRENISENITKFQESRNTMKTEQILVLNNSTHKEREKENSSYEKNCYSFNQKSVQLIDGLLREEVTKASEVNKPESRIACTPSQQTTQQKYKDQTERHLTVPLQPQHQPTEQIQNQRSGIVASQGKTSSNNRPICRSISDASMTDIPSFFRSINDAKYYGIDKDEPLDDQNMALNFDIIDMLQLSEQSKSSKNSNKNVLKLEIHKGLSVCDSGNDFETAEKKQENTLEGMKLNPNTKTSATSERNVVDTMTSGEGSPTFDSVNSDRLKMRRFALSNPEKMIMSQEDRERIEREVEKKKASMVHKVSQFFNVQLGLNKEEDLI